MDTSNDDPDYPPRLFTEGNAPFQNHSMNHNCYLNKFTIVRESLGEEVWESMKESSVGVILMLSKMKYIFSSKIVHQFLTNQLQTSKSHEMWSVIGGQPVRFSLIEFGELTGLKCHPYPDEDSSDVDHIGFWKEMGVSAILGPCWEELLEVLLSCATWIFSKRKMVGLLCVMSVGIFGIHRTSRIPLEAAKRVLDLDAFEIYPWGRVACKSLISGVKVVTYKKDSYLVKGLVHVLQIWAYESVEILGERLGKIRDDKDIIPLLRWKGSRDRFNLTEILEQELKTYGKVRVHNLCIKPHAEIFPEWVDDVEDIRLQTLVDNLLHNCFIQCFYEPVVKRNATKMKYVSAAPSSQKEKKGKIEVNRTSQTRGDEGDSKHMDDIMKTFTLRSMSKNSSYCSPRIAFLDPIFVNTMVKDLPQFDMGPKKFMFSEGYTRAFNGNSHDSASTNLKWFVDIDHLYITHHIRSNHWAALNVNLKEKRIDVYDNIESTTSNNEILVLRRPFTRMIPHLLSLHVPVELRKKKTAMFLINRVKEIPQNIDAGDCGVFTVKYIEGLALGEDFEGLCDANMPAFRLQLAFDLFNEIHLPELNKCLKKPELKDEYLDDLDDSYTSPN